MKNYCFSLFVQLRAKALLLTGLVLLTASAAQAQMTVTGRSPARNAAAAARTANVGLTFSQSVQASTAGNVRVFSVQRGGQLVRTGSAVVTTSTTTITVDPTTDFRPGELISVTVPATVTSTTSVAATKQVYQFTAAVAPGNLTTGISPGLFSPGSTQAIGNNVSYSVALGDLDNDGDLDLVRANFNGTTGTVSVRVNDGTGTYSGSQEVSVAASPRSVALGDIDNDGDLDMVVGCYVDPGILSIRFNDGTGTFSGTTNLSTGSTATYPNSIHLADLDGDGDLDVAATNFLNSAVTVRLNNGSGVFSGGSAVAVGTNPFGLDLGDIDGDGDLDLVVTNSTGTTVAIRLNNGSATFAGTGTVTVNSGPAFPALGDLDGDGDLDLVCSSADPSTQAGTVSVRLNDGTGTFSGTQSLAVGTGASQIVLSDVDGDNDLDFVVSNNNTTTVSVRLNDGMGTFSGSQNVSAVSGLGGLAMGDVDGDGDVDMAVGIYSGSTASVAIRLNKPNAPTITSFGPSSAVPGTTVTMTGTNLGGATLLVNGVAVTPIVLSATSLTFVVPAGASNTQSVSVTTPGGGATSTGFTVLLLVTPITPAVNALAGPVANSALSLTFTEAVTSASAQTLKVFSAQVGGLKAGTVTLSNGGSTARYASTLTSPRTNFQAGELISVTVPATVLGTGGLQVRRKVYQFTTAVYGPGPGTFTGGSDPAVGSTPAGVAVGDVDGDGDLDLLAANTGSSTVSVRLNDGTGIFGGTQDVAVGTGPQAVVLGDVDGDGDLDLLTTSNANTSTVSIRLNDGTGTFGGGSDPSAGFRTGPKGIALGDLDGDGDLDFVAVYNNITPAQVGPFFNNGSGTFTAGTVLSLTSSAGSAGYGIALGDVDSDGDLDLLATTSAGVNVRLNSGLGAFSGTQLVTVTGTPRFLAVGDVDGDGDLDLVTGNTGATAVSLRLNNGSGTFSGSTDVSVGTNPNSVALGDVDSDGDLDLLAANTADNTVSVRFNNGTGNFSGSQDVAVGTGPQAMVLGDVDGDGDLDLFTANQTSGTVTMRYNRVAPLPVELVAFTATRQNRAVALAWRTASEKNTAHFEVERSLDGHDFAPVGQVAAAGSSASARSYALTDACLPASAVWLYYRLRQVDLDGTVSYSPVRTLTLPAHQVLVLALFPNPAGPTTLLTGAAPDVAVTVLDAVGRSVAVARTDAAGQVGLGQLATLPGGLYTVRVGQLSAKLLVK